MLTGPLHHRSRCRPVVTVFVVVGGLSLAACGGGSPLAHTGFTSEAQSTGGVKSMSATSAPPAVPGVSATTISIGSHQPLTGVFGPGNAEIAPAEQAYFDAVNAHGGVYGRKIVYEVEDDQSNPIKAKSIVSRFISDDNVFAVFNGLVTTNHQAVAGDLASAGVPDVFVGSGCACWNQPTVRPRTFGWEPNVTAEGKVLATYVRTHYPGVPVGVLYQNDAYGQGGLAGVREVLPAAQLVDVESYSTTNSSLAGQVAALRAKQAKIVISFSVPTFTAELALTSGDLGYHPRFVVSRAGADPTAVTTEIERQTAHNATPSGAGVLNGVATDSFLPSAEDLSNPWVALFRSIHAADANIAGMPFDDNTVYGMAAAYSFVAALEAAGPVLTRASFVAALNRLTLSPTGPALGSLTYSLSNHGGFTGMRIGVIEGGSVTLSGPVFASDGARGPVTSRPVGRPAIPPGSVPVG